MKENTVNKNGYRVSFSYIKSPLEKHSIDINQKLQQNPLTILQLGGKKERTFQLKTTQINSNTHIHHYSQEQTLRKEGWGVEATTTRKQMGKKMTLNLYQQTDIITLRQDSPCKISRNSETALLNEEIRYMRNRLIQVENSQKALRLQFQLYKANSQVPNGLNLQITQQNEDQQMVVKGNNSKLLLAQKIQQQQRNKSQLQLRIAQEISQRQQISTENDRLNETVIAKLSQVQSLQQKLQDLSNSLRQSKQEIQALKYKKQNEINHHNFSTQLQKISQENERLNVLFQSQKKAKVFLQGQLKNSSLEKSKLTVRVDQLTNQVDQRYKDIDFLNQQSYNLDMSLNQAFQQISYLKAKLAQNEEKASGKAQLTRTRQQLRCLQLHILELEGQLQKKGMTIYNIQSQFASISQKLNEQLLTIEQLRQKGQILEKERLRIQKAKLQDDEKNIKRISHIQDELIFAKAQNNQLRIQKQKLEEKQRLLTNQIEWIINERDVTAHKLENKHQEQTNLLLKAIQELKNEKESCQFHLRAEVVLKEKQIIKLSRKCESLTNEYEENIKKINSKYHENEFLGGPQNQPQQQNKGGNTLTQSQLKMHLLQIKKQSSINQQQNSKLRQMLYTAKQQLQIAKQQHEYEMSQTRQQYQKQLAQNNQQYTAQFNLYIEEIQRLMAQMDKIRTVSKYCSSQVIEQEPEENEADNQKVQKDLIMYGQDPSDFYVSPPSNIPNKQNNQEESENNYMLQDIIDLDLKIHSYISNLNKKQNKTDQ